MAPYVWVENGRVVCRPDRSVGDSPRPKMWRAGAIAEGFEHETCLLELTNRAEQYIADRVGGGRPFFLYFPTNSPHTPHVPRAPFRGRSRAGAYGDFVCEHDWSIGRVVAALERAGLADDTLIIVTSDNGAHMRGGGFDFEREYDHRSNHIYRGQKSDIWDGGHRVPFLARWPGVIAEGTACDRTICLTDLLATCAELVGTELPDGAGEDSVSHLPLLRGDDAPIREHVVHHSFDGRFAIRSGDWKLVECRGSGGWSLPEANVPDDAPPGQLYHMADDPAEQHNLYRERPDEVRRLQDMLDHSRNAN
jgi:arylsulfatase A-like enzyme